MRRALVAGLVALATASAVAGCSDDDTVTPATTTSTTPASSSPSPTPSPSAHPKCPHPSGEGTVAIDYVDFVQAFGRQYVAGLPEHGTSGLTRDDLGRVVLRSRCSFSALNDRTHRNPGPPRDGDTGFLPTGTPIYAIDGWSPQCRLAAERDGELRSYLAYRKGDNSVQPRPCALNR